MFSVTNKDPNTGNATFNTDYSDSRFGKLAYISPMQSWPRQGMIAQKYGVTINPVEGKSNTYKWLYDRVKGREIGNVTLTNMYADQGRINPYTADRLLDYKDYLDRVDPNRFHYDLTSLTRQPTAYTPYIGDSQTGIDAVKTGVEAEQIQQRYRPFERVGNYYG